MKIAEFANSVDLDEVVHDEPPHLDLYCLPYNFVYNFGLSECSRVNSLATSDENS